MKLPRSFFARPSVIVARELIGCYFAKGALLVRIVETEAYLGDGTDPASHAHNGQTPRNLVMFGPPGHLYVYRSYGIHFCANIVCGDRPPQAVLLRAAEPVEGEAVMRRNRGLSRDVSSHAILRGPGNFCKGLGITLAHNGASLLSGAFSLRAPRKSDTDFEVGVSSRIGISKAVEHPYRFFIVDDAHVSGPRKKNGAQGRASRKERRHA
ncbi:MAG TPA: DNA-3-methyladenine glycosylase [Candidatus Krumholzibacteria bacterium]|nr:DNA-3-methyladenine glycosylase [Candidatus Krumholzibacteria bacterium]